MSNGVDHPDYYNKGGIECLDAIKASMTEEAYRGFLKGNTIKYVWRYESKEKPLQDLKKAKFYLEKLILQLITEKETTNEIISDDKMPIRYAQVDKI